MMAMLWAQQIMLGKKTYGQVPRLTQGQGKRSLGMIPEWESLRMTNSEAVINMGIRARPKGLIFIQKIQESRYIECM